MENNVNINNLANKFFAARSEETYCDLFAAVFALPNWHFIAVGEMPNLSPYCAIFPDKSAHQFRTAEYSRHTFGGVIFQF